MRCGRRRPCRLWGRKKDKGRGRDEGYDGREGVGTKVRRARAAKVEYVGLVSPLCRETSRVQAKLRPAQLELLLSTKDVSLKDCGKYFLAQGKETRAGHQSTASIPVLLCRGSRNQVSLQKGCRHAYGDKLRGGTDGTHGLENEQAGGPLTPDGSQEMGRRWSGET